MEKKQYKKVKERFNRTGIITLIIGITMTILSLIFRFFNIFNTSVIWILVEIGFLMIVLGIMCKITSLGMKKNKFKLIIYKETEDNVLT